MRLKIIGSAAGGGFPQWNCNYRLSRAARTGMAGVHSRTQSSIAASVDGAGWVLFNASPDIRQQIAQTPELQPAHDAPLRSTPIRAVVLTNADVDHVAGLLSLRERQPFAIYATTQVLATLEANSIFNVLDPALVPRRTLPPAEELAICDADGHDTGVTVECFPVPGKIALYLEERSRPDANFSSDAGDTIGVRICGAGSRGSAFYIPGCARIDAALRKRLADAACVLFDGTVYTDDEMIAAGVGQKTGARMGHL
ncbi:MAG: pyrroloquinoline quinone biosynthesis protein PqqB, partial [Mesorhizobium sp.]